MAGAWTAIAVIVGKAGGGEGSTARKGKKGAFTTGR